MKNQLPASDLKERIFSRIDEYKTVTFSELRWIPGFKGDQTACISTNVIVWTEISSEAISAINELIEEGSIEVRPYRPRWQGVMTYGFDGGVLALPLARAVRRYKHPRWLPVYISESQWSRKVGERFNGGRARRGRPPKKRFLMLGDN